MGKMQMRKMLINPHKYPYAIDDNGKPIYIDSVTNENRRDTHYHCYGCGAELYPVLCTKKESHFRHEKDAICDPDKYLHEYAKARLKERFDNSETFEIQYYVTYRCKNISTCKFAQYGWKECERKELKKVNLKEYYDTCTPEKGYYQELSDGRKKYIADLILTNSKEAKIPALCIEVWVTHECTEDKKQNGGRIIEIKVESEEDANRPLVETDRFAEKPIRVYNFSNCLKEIEPGRQFKHVKLLHGLMTDFVVATEMSLCSEGLNFDPKALYEIVLAKGDLQNSIIELIFAAYCNEHNMRYSQAELCRNEINIHGQRERRVHCNFPVAAKSCPCDHFKYDSSKLQNILRNLPNDCPIWDKNEQLHGVTGRQTYLWDEELKKIEP